MARIRTIKPEFWEDDVVGSLTRDQRLLFIATWTLADDEGLLRWTASYLKASAFIYDADISVKAVEAMMAKLEGVGLVFGYSGGKGSAQRFACIPNFHKHQKINRPTPSRLPAPSLQSPAVKEMYGERDGWICHLCGQSIDRTIEPGKRNDFTVSMDHLRPASKGGSDFPSNIRSAHVTCNKGRKDRTVEEYRAILARGGTAAQGRHPEQLTEPLTEPVVSGSPLEREREREEEREDQPSSPSTTSFIFNDDELLPRAREPAREPPPPAEPENTQRHQPKLDWTAAAQAVKATLKARYPDYELQVDMMDAGIVRQWLADGCDLQLDIVNPIDVVCGERIQSGREFGPPNTLKYFHKRVIEHHRERTMKPATAALPEGTVEYGGTAWTIEQLRELWRMRINWLKDRPWMAAWKDAPQPHTRDAQPPAGLPVDIWALALEAHWRFVDVQAGRRRA